MTTRRGHIRRALLGESIGGLSEKLDALGRKVERQLSEVEAVAGGALSELAEHGAPGDEVSIAQRGHHGSVEWPLGEMSADDVCVTLSGRLFELHAETPDHERAAGGALLLPFELIAEETLAVVENGTLKVSGPIAREG